MVGIVKVRLSLIAAFVFSFVFLTLKSSHGVMPIKQDESEVKSGKTPTQKMIMTGSMEDVKKKKKEILEAEKGKPKKEEEDFLQKRKPYMLTEAMKSLHPEEEEKAKEPAKGPQPSPKKRLFGMIFPLLALFLIAYLFYRYMLTRFGTSKDSQK